MLSKTIFTGFSPNTTRTDFINALGFIFLPWNWLALKNGKNIRMVENWLEKYLGTKHVQTFDSGRSALFYALKSVGVGEQDEVLIQAFTCVVVSNAVKWTNANPVYVDINEKLCMDINDLKRKITKKTKAIVVQHTFGVAADIENIIKIAKEHNLKIIEDCAHSLGVKLNGKKIGTFGDIGIYSFGSDKIISSVRGGAISTDNEEIFNKIQIFHSRLPLMNTIIIFQHLMHVPIFYLCKKIYHLYVGKIILKIAKIFYLINKIIYTSEKLGKNVLFFPAKFPNALAFLLYENMSKIEEFNLHRKKISKIYFNNLSNIGDIILPEGKDVPYLRFNILSEKAKELINFAAKRGVIFGDWYRCVIAPCDADLKISGYSLGVCPNAEKYAQMSVNLPTDINISEKNAVKIINIIRRFYQKAKL